MDPKLLAEALVLLLAQALPSLLAAGEKAAGKAVEEVGKQAGAAVSGKVKEIWDRLRGRVEENPRAAGAVQDVAQTPEDEDVRAALRVQLRKLLEADPALAADLAPRVEAITSIQAWGRAVVATHGGVAGGTVAVGGNVYGGISMSGKEGGTDPTALRRDYLTRLMEQVGVLSLAGIDPAAAGKQGEAQLSLDAVYTALRTLSPEDRENRERMETRRLSALEQLNRHSRLVLLGDPGSGKSTFVHFVALCHTGEALGHPHIHLNLLRTPMPQEQPLDREKKPEPQPWDHGPLLPVRVVLRDFAARGLPLPGERVTARHLQEFLERELKDDCLGEYDLFKDLRETGGLLLFDGLDEVPEADSRRERIRRWSRLSPGLSGSVASW